MKKIGKVRKRQELTNISVIYLTVVFILNGLLLISIAENFHSVNFAKNVIYVPDDYVKIQWAIDNATDGDTITVRDGSYYENVVIDKSITLKSENGSANCIIDGNGNGDVVKITANNVTVEGFTITNSSHVGVRMESSGTTIVNNTITHCGYGIYLNPYSSYNKIISNNISNGDCIYLDKSNNNTINNNTLSNGWDGIYLRESDNNTISYNNVTSNNAQGIEISSSTNNNIISNIISYNLGKGIYLYSTSNNNTILYNKITYSRYDGIEIDSSIKNEIAFNNISNNNRYGIWLKGSGNCNINNNTIILNEQDGILLDSSNHNQIEFNIIYNNTQNGIHLSLSGNNKIIQNKILYNRVDGIYLSEANNNNITLNNLSSNNKIGIYISSSTNNNITFNSIISNKETGIYLSSSTNNNIKYNYISSNNWHGIVLIDSSSNNDIISNKIYYNNYYGISLYPSCNNNTIILNNISFNGIYALWFNSSSNNLIYLNNFINNTHQVYSHNATNHWYSPKLLNYTYNGTNYTSYLGNYWSDYNGSDANGDGIGDFPYIINSNNNDSYPLMKIIENYDSTPPQIKITSPYNNSTINNSTVTISWQGSDFWSGIDHYEIKIDNGSWINVGLNTSYTFTNLPNGNHTAYVKAVDSAGNTAIDSVTFVVSTPVPEFTGTFINLTIIALITIVSAALIRKKSFP